MSLSGGASGETVVVTGGSGFIGTALSSGLGDAYDRVVVVDNLSPRSTHVGSGRPSSTQESNSSSVTFAKPMFGSPS